MSEAYGVTTLPVQITPVPPHSATAGVPLAAQDVASPGQGRVGASGMPEWYLYGLAGLVVLGFFALTVTMILTEISQNSQSMAYMLLGGLVTGFSMVLSYFFGSSASSAQKTAQLAKLMRQGASRSYSPLEPGGALGQSLHGSEGA